MGKLTFDPKEHKYTHEGQPIISVTQILGAVGISDFSKVRASVLEPAKKFGTALHKASELDDRGVLDESTLSAPLVPYLNAWRSFKRDLNITIVEIEFKVHSHKYDYCGTLDKTFLINGKCILADLKSGSTYPATRLQTAAYKIAYEEETSIKISERWCIQLREDGKYNIIKYNERTDEMYFLACRKVYKFRKENGLL